MKTKTNILHGKFRIWITPRQQSPRGTNASKAVGITLNYDLNIILMSGGI